jgi:hypothetical protein
MSDTIGCMEIRWTRASRKHRISRQRSGYVVQNVEITVTIPAPADSPEKTDERTLHLGRDSQGVLLEVVTVPTENGVLIIHAMPMRPRYQKLL